MAEIVPLFPENLESVAKSFGSRAALEEGYMALLEPGIRRFMEEVGAETRQAVYEGRSVSTLTITLAWNRLVEHAEEVLPEASMMLTTLRTSDYASETAEAAQRIAMTAIALALVGSAVDPIVNTALGLSRTPVEHMGGAFGKMLLTPEEPMRRAVGLSPMPGSASLTDSVRSWTAQNEMWARTASTADYGDAMMNLLRDEGYTHKRWHSRYDSRVRATHMDVDALTLPLEQSFLVGGTALMYPGDPMTTDFGEIANCRCVLTGVRYGQHDLDHPEGTEPWNNPRPV